MASGADDRNRAAVERLVRQLRQGTAISVRTLGLEVHNQLVQATPVKTGFARSRWRVVDQALGDQLGISARIGSGSRGRVGGALVSTRRVTTRQNTPARFRAVTGTRGVSGSRITPVHVVNDAPYIGRLNDGHSRQAPRGFVQQAIRRAIRVADIKLGNLDRLVA